MYTLCHAYNMKSTLFNKKMDSVPIPYPWFNLSNISLTKNLSKGKNFKNDCYEYVQESTL